MVKPPSFNRTSNPSATSSMQYRPQAANITRPMHHPCPSSYRATRVLSSLLQFRSRQRATRVRPLAHRPARQRQTKFEALPPAVEYERRLSRATLIFPGPPECQPRRILTAPETYVAPVTLPVRRRHSPLPPPPWPPCPPCPPCPSPPLWRHQPCPPARVSRRLDRLDRPG